MNRVRTPSSPVREKDRGREREREIKRDRERKRDGEIKRDRGRKREGEGERFVIFIFKRNDGCLGTF